MISTLEVECGSEMLGDLYTTPDVYEVERNLTCPANQVFESGLAEEGSKCTALAEWSHGQNIIECQCKIYSTFKFSFVTLSVDIATPQSHHRVFILMKLLFK